MSDTGVPSYRALFRVPALGRVLLSMAVSRIAAAMLAITLVLFTLSEYESPVLAGVVAFMAMFPGILVSPIAGALLDRHGRARLVVLDYVLSGLACFAIGGLAIAQLLPTWLLVTLVTLTGLTFPLSTAGLRSLLPLLVPKGLWERANAIDSNGYVIAGLLGPALAGGLVAVLGGAGAIVVIGGVFLSAAAIALRIPDPAMATASSGNLLRDAWEGLRYVAGHPTLRALGLSISLLNAAFGVLQIAVPVMLLRLGYGPAVVGVVWASMGAAGLIAAIVSGRMDSRGREKALIMWPMFGIAAAMVVLLLPAGVTVVVVVLIMFGFLNGPLDIGLFTIRQRRTDPAWMGRAYAISMSINATGSPIGAAVAGVLVGLSMDLTVLAAAASCVAGGLACLALIPDDAETVHVPRVVA